MPKSAGLELSKLLGAIKNPVRWRMLGAMIGGEPMSVTELVGAGRVNYQTGIKHIKVLTASGLLRPYKGRLYQLSPLCTLDREAGTIDFGHLLGRFR